MGTLGSILEIGNITFFLVVFMALASIPKLWTRIEARKLREETEKLVKIVERLELGKEMEKTPY
jgi:hypothetical protein